ncbi:MAG: hypothetical protein HY903_18840 [Deltaproteobacteria bacterium]|nr:hypothetical protein [Deltaproteobacteria bacterium]
MAKKSTLSIESLSRGHISYVRLYGTIDETFDPAALIEAAVGRDVILNMKAVSRISSFGLRDWVHTVETLSKTVDRILLMECSPSVVAQLNMVANFGAGATVASVQAPYFCEQCEWDTEVTVPLGDANTPVKLPEVKCRRCSTVMILDDDPETYFGFRSGVRTQALDPRLAAFIADFSRPIDAQSAGVGVAAAPAAPVSAPPGRPAALEEVKDETTRTPMRFRDTARSTAKIVTSHPKAALAAGVALVGIVALIIGMMLARSSGIPPRRLAQLQEQIGAGRFAKAEEIIAQFKRDGLLTRDLGAFFAKQVADGRTKAVAERRARILAAVQARRPEDVISAATKTIDGAVLDVDLVFLLAEAYRSLNRCGEALPYYAAFDVEMSKSNPADKRLDDAVFWEGDCASQLGKSELARGHFRRVASDLPRGDFRNSAIARLRAMDKQ